MHSSSDIALQRLDTTAIPGWIERFSLVEKAPFALFFGALLGLSAPGFDFAWIAWVGLAPLLVLIRSAGSKLEATAIGLIYGGGYYLVALSWYLGLFPLRWLGLDDWVAVQAVGLVWLVESLHQAILFAAFAWLIASLPLRAGFLPHWQRPFFPYLLSIPIMWIFFQWVIATSEVFLGMPVNQLAYTQHNLLDFIQMAKLGGCGLIDFFLIASNCAVAALIFEITPLVSKLEPRTDQIAPKVGALADVLLVSCAVMGFMFWGATSVRNIAMQARCENEDHFLTQTPAIPVALLQGNVSIEEEKFRTIDSAEIAKRYAGLGTGTGALMLFLPEAIADPKQFAPGLLISKLKGIVNSERKEAIVGTIEKVPGGFVSAARMIANPQPKDNIYVKQRVVPFGETAPLGAIGAISSKLTSTVPGTMPEKMLSSKYGDLLGSMFGKVGVSISTEIIFPNLIAQEVRRGAQLLVNISNLNRFHTSGLNKQVVAAATLRAVENGRFMVLATNTGVSAVIDPAGVVTTKSMPNKRGVVIDTVQFLYNKTPFNKMSRMWWL